jgi:hypothetical protein
MNLAKVAVGAPLYALGRGDIADKIGATEMLEPVSPARRAMQAVGAGNVKPVTGFQNAGLRGSGHTVRCVFPCNYCWRFA